MKHNRKLAYIISMGMTGITGIILLWVFHCLRPELDVVWGLMVGYMVGQVQAGIDDGYHYYK